MLVTNLQLSHVSEPRERNDPYLDFLSDKVSTSRLADFMHDVGVVSSRKGRRVRRKGVEKDYTKVYCQRQLGGRKLLLYIS